VGANPSGVARRGALLADRGRSHLRAGQLLIDGERPGHGCRWGRPGNAGPGDGSGFRADGAHRPRAALL